MTKKKKKKSSEILERIEGNFFKIFCLKVNLPKIFAPQYVTQIFAPNICDPNFCPPNIYDKSTPMVACIREHAPTSVSVIVQKED